LKPAAAPGTDDPTRNHTVYPMKPPFSPLAATACVLALCLGCAGIARAAPLDDLRRQIEAGQFEAAFATAQANPQLIGDVHFDFLYGVAAINVGRVPEGLLALERHLAAVPANDRARLELARGYFLLGDYTRSRAEFEFVLRYNPPAGVRNTIAGFLQAMQTRDAGDRRAAARFYAEAGIGHDSNVNGGTFRDQFDTAFGVVSISGTPSQQVRDTVAQVAIGGQQLWRVTQRLSVFAGADLDHRANAEHDEYDLTNGGVYAGFSQLSGQALWRLTLAASELMVGGNRYRDTLSATLEASRPLGADTNFMAFGQYAELRHAKADEVRDGRSTTIGAMVTHGFPQLAGTPQVGLRLSWTQEDNLRQRKDLSRSVPLVRLFASVTPIERLRVAVGLSAYQQKFEQPDIAIGSQRSDTAVAADFVATYALSNHWSVRGDALWTSNRSNQDLYDSSRKAASIKVRYQF
jgi:tetratricopeptide (TPR) repeat protein